MKFGEHSWVFDVTCVFSSTCDTKIIVFFCVYLDFCSSSSSNRSIFVTLPAESLFYEYHAVVLKNQCRFHVYNQGILVLHHLFCICSLIQRVQGVMATFLLNGFSSPNFFFWGGWVRAHFEVIKWSPPGRANPTKKKSKKVWVLSEVVYLLF